MNKHLTRRCASGRFRISPAPALTLAVLLGIGVTSAPSIRATTYYWDGGGSDTSVTTGANWQGNAAPPVDGSADVVFTDSLFSSGHTDTTPNLSVNFLVDSLTFAGGSSFTIGSTNSRGLDIGAGGLSQNSTAAQTITVPTFLTANQTWSFASSAGALTFSGNGSVNLQSYTLTVAPAGSNTLNANVSGTGTLVVDGGAGTLTLAGTVSLPNEYVGYNGTGALTQSSGGSTLSSALYLGYGSGANGTYTLGGTGMLSTPYEYVGDDGAGTFNQSGGTNTISNTLYLGYDSSGSLGTYNLSGTGTLSAPVEYVGRSGPGTFNQSGGTNTVSNTLYLGYQGGSAGISGTYTLSGTSSTLSASVERISYGGPGAFTQNGGTNTVSNTLYLGYDSSTNNPDGSVTTYRGPGQYSLNGGVLQAASVTAGGVQSTFVFNGGTLRAGAGSTSFFQGLTTANVQAGGALIDTNGYNITVAQALLHDTTNGAPVTDGGLTKLGAGTLTLTGTNTYTGGTSVNAGTLALTSGGLVGRYMDLGGDSPGTFTQSGGSNTINGTLYVGYSKIGSYNLSGTGSTLSAASEYIGYNGYGQLNTFTQGGGTNTVSGTLYISNYTVYNNGQSVFFGIGTYNLNGGVLQAASVADGGGGGSTFNFNGGTLRAGASDNPGASSNPSTFLAGLTTANVQAGGALIDTNGYNVTIAQELVSGTASSTPDGGLTKLGSGTLTLTAACAYTGPTTINVGTLTMNNNPGASTPTAGQLSKTSGITVNNGGTLLLSGSASVTDRLNNAATVLLNGGGTLGTGGLNEGTAPTGAGGAGGAAGVGALTLATTTSTSRASIDFGTAGTGSALVFSSLSASSAGAYVSILDYTGTARADNGAATNDRLLFATDPGFTTANLANWQFSNDAGVAFATGGMEIAYNGYFEIVPVPEPATWVGGALALAAGGAGFLGGSRARAAKRTGGDGVRRRTSFFAARVHFFPRNRQNAGGRAPGPSLPSPVMNPPCFRLPLVRTLVCATLLAAGTAPLPGRATTYTWDGGGTHNDWKDNLNWTSNVAPVSSVDTSLVFAGTTQLISTQDLANPFLLNALTFDSTAGAFVLGGSALDFSTSSAGTLPTLTQNSASAETINNALTLANNLTVGGTGTGTLTLGGALNGAGGLIIAGSGTTLLTGTNTYTGTTTVNTGTLAVTGSVTGGAINVGTGATLAISGAGSVSPGSSHTLTVDGTAASPARVTLAGTGSLSTGYVYVGYGGAGAFTQSGGSFTTNGNGLFLGYSSGGGTYTLSGGTLTTGTTQVSDNVNTSTFTQSGGTHTTGTLGLTGFQTGSVGTYSLNGGVLNTGSVVNHDPFNTTTGTSTFNFNGGTLQAAGSNTAFLQGLTTANVQAGGAKVDT